MRRYTVRIDETEHVLEVEETTADTFTVHLGDGRSVGVVLTDHQDLAQAVIGPEIEVRARPVTGPPAVRAERAPAAAAANVPRRPSGPPGGNLTAPMPGVIISVDVAVGATVEPGQTLLVLEAMKMMNELKSQRNGRVAAIRVAAGDQVKHGDVLVEFEG